MDMSTGNMGALLSSGLRLHLDTDPADPSCRLWDLSGPTGILKANRTFARAMTVIANKEWVPEADRNQIERIVNQWERSEEAFKESTEAWRLGLLTSGPRAW